MTLALMKKSWMTTMMMMTTCVFLQLVEDFLTLNMCYHLSLHHLHTPLHWHLTHHRLMLASWTLMINLASHLDFRLGHSLILLDLRTPLNLDLLSQLDPMDFMDLLNFYLIQRWMCLSVSGNHHENPVQKLHFKYLNFLNHLNSQLLKLHNLTHTLPLCTNLRQMKIFELTDVASNSKRPCRLAHIDVHHLHVQSHMILQNLTKKAMILDFHHLTLRISKLRHCQQVGSLKTATSPWKTTPKIFGSSKQDVWFDITLFLAGHFLTPELFLPKTSAICQFFSNSWTMWGLLSPSMTMALDILLTRSKTAMAPCPTLHGWLHCFPTQWRYSQRTWTSCICCHDCKTDWQEREAQRTRKMRKVAPKNEINERKLSLEDRLLFHQAKVKQRCLDFPDHKRGRSCPHTDEQNFVEVVEECRRHPTCKGETRRAWLCWCRRLSRRARHCISSFDKVG